MAWEIRFTQSARKLFDKLDRPIQKKIIKFLNLKIAPLDNPRVFGKPLSYEKHGLWRYRLEDFRIVCKIDDDAIVILVVNVGHRKNIYHE